MMNLFLWTLLVTPFIILYKLLEPLFIGLYWKFKYGKKVEIRFKLISGINYFTQKSNKENNDSMYFIGKSVLHIEKIKY